MYNDNLIWIIWLLEEFIFPISSNVQEHNSNIIFFASSESVKYLIWLDSAIGQLCNEEN